MLKRVVKVVEALPKIVHRSAIFQVVGFLCLGRMKTHTFTVLLDATYEDCGCSVGNTLGSVALIIARELAFAVCTLGSEIISKGNYLRGHPCKWCAIFRDSSLSCYFVFLMMESLHNYINLHYEGPLHSSIEIKGLMSKP